MTRRPLQCDRCRRACGADIPNGPRGLRLKARRGRRERGVEGDSRGLDKQNNGRGVPFEMRASVLLAASLVFARRQKKRTGRLAVNRNATRTDGCAAGCIRAALRQRITAAVNT